MEPSKHFKRYGQNLKDWSEPGTCLPTDRYVRIEQVADRIVEVELGETLFVMSIEEFRSLHTRLEFMLRNIDKFEVELK